MKTFNKKLAITIAIIFVGIAIIQFSLKTSFGATNTEDKNAVISTMSVYKDMDYTFLKTYNFGGTNSDKSILTFNTAEELKLSEDIRLKKSKYITTKGYYEEGDLGGATYLISDKAEANGTIELKNGLYANIVPDAYTSEDGTKWVVISIKQCGAKGDGENEDHIGINVALNLANDYAKSDEYDRGIVYIPAGEYKAYDQIQANVQNVNLVGDGDESIVFTDNDYRKTRSYDEPFFASWYGNNNFFGFFKLDAREVNWKRYMRQMCLFYCENVYLYDITYYIPQEAWTGTYYEDKQYTNLTIYAGNKVVTVDNCLMYQMSGTYRGANIGIMDFWQTGTEDITIMNCELHDNARDEQIGIFSVTGKPESYIKNVDFINNTVYTYTTPYKEIHGGRTMCFTVAYGDNEVDDINISGNHFISEIDSKFMTFGDVTNCKVTNNTFEIKCLYNSGSYVFDSSCSNDSDVLIDNNEFFLTYKNSTSEGRTFAAGHLTFSNNRVVSDCIIGKISDRLGIYDNNKFIALNGITSFGSAITCTNNNLTAYAGHNGFYSEIFFLLSGGDENTDIVYTGNTVNDYSYFYDYKAKKPFDRLSSINGGTLNSLNFSNNVYNCPNYSYKDDSYIYITWYRGANVKNFICKDNDFQGVKGMIGYENDESLNTTREFTSNPDIPRITSMDITNNGEKVTEITTTESRISLDKIVKIAKETDEEGNILSEEEVTDRDIDWVSALESIASVEDGVVTRNGYGSVYIYATSKDGSGVYAKVKINFIESNAQDIEFTEDEISLRVGQEYHIMYKVLPFEGTSQSVKWESSDESIVTVDQSGNLTSIALGSAIITATTTDGTNISKTINVTVEPSVVTKITLNKTYDYFEDPGEKVQLEVTSYTPSDAINQSVGRWASSDEEVATVDSNGLVTVVGRGNCTIYAYSTDESCYAIYNVYVTTAAPTNITATATSTTTSTVKWDDMEHMWGYNLYRKEADGEWKQIAYHIHYSTFYDSGLTPGTEYSYKVVGYTCGYDTGTEVMYEGLESDVVTITTNTENVITSITTGTKNIAVTPNDEVAVYLGYTPKNADFAGFEYSLGDESIATITEWNSNEIRIRGKEVGFTTLTISSKNSDATLTIPVGSMPAYKVTDFELDTYYNNVEIKWKPIEEENEIDGYLIYRTQSAVLYPEYYISLDELSKSTYSDDEECYTYLDTGLSFGNGYRYAITPYIVHDGLIYTCSRSSDKSITIDEYVAIESIVAEDEYILNLGEEKEIFVETDTENVSREEFVWYSKNEDIVTVETNSKTSAILKGVSTGISIIEIIANDEDCNYISPKVVVLPNVVSSFNAVADEQKVTLSWDSVKGATGYNIYRYNDDSNEWKLLNSTANCKYEDINLEANKEYAYKISAYIADSEKSYEGELSDEVKVVSNIEFEKPEEPIEPTEKLYLTSDKYKIEDKYISRIGRELTKAEFVNNLQTNGIIKILKQDGTELKENELVGTGMLLEIKREEEKIELKVAVMGDLSGDGKVTAQDLSTINQTILEILTLNDEYKVAADLDENGKLTATDLSTVNEMVLKVL